MQPHQRLADFATFLCLTCAASAAALDPASPRTPQTAAAAFRFADTNLFADLVAAEPEVVSPVCIAWDAEGRMFAAEMSDYPNGPGKGRIKMLEDTDGDGRYERASVFAEGLPFPTSVLPWNGGVLVTAAPEILFFKDTNGDGQADERRVLFTGFGEGNQQLRVNGLRWGMDNWVYGANGRSDGEVRRPGDPAGKATSLRRRDFRFKPATGEFEALAGQSQFGTASDDWGNRFLSWNTIPVRHVVIEQRYLERNPYLGAAEAIQDLLPPGDTGQVFPLTPAPLVFNEESSSHFNALAGLLIFRGDAQGLENYRHNVFAGETLRNLVHRRVLKPNLVSFVAERAERGGEFLASADPWFHPVNFATGPDGALYIVDFYRRFVEHPAYVHDKSRTSTIPWREGAEHGRIWRIRSKVNSVSSTARKLELSRAPSAELVRLLDHRNGWHRDTAQRLLVERQDKSAADLLKGLVRQDASPAGSVHALWTLEAMGELDENSLLHALRRKPDPGSPVAAHALRAAERRLANSEALRAAVLDPSPLLVPASLPREHTQVWLQWILTLGEISDPKRFEALARLSDDFLRLKPLYESVDRVAARRWFRLAIFSSIGKEPGEYFKALKPRLPEPISVDTAEDAEFVEQLARMIAARGNEADLNALMDWWAGPACGPEPPWKTRRPQPIRPLDGSTRAVVLAGVATGLNLAPAGFEGWVKAQEKRLSDRPPYFLQARAAAFAVPMDAQAPLHVRLAALRALAHFDDPDGREALFRLLLPGFPSEIQIAACEAVAKVNHPGLSWAAFKDWPQFSKAVQRRLIAQAARSDTLAAALLESVEAGVVPLLRVDPAARQALRNLKDEALRGKAEKLFQSLASPDRAGVLQQFEPALKLAGDPKRGGAMFAKNCLSCHNMLGQGNRVGPDLSGVGTRPKEALLVDLLEPSRAVSPDYFSYTLEPVEGQIMSGIITAEHEGSVTLRVPNQPETTLNRRQIKSLKADGKSLMPDGLEQGLTPQDMADLLEFLRRPAAQWLVE